MAPLRSVTFTKTLTSLTSTCSVKSCAATGRTENIAKVAIASNWTRLGSQQKLGAPFLRSLFAARMGGHESREHRVLLLMRALRRRHSHPDRKRLARRPHSPIHKLLF